MNKENKNIIEKITNFIKSKEDIRFAYVFGSFALANVSAKSRTNVEISSLNKKNFNDIDMGIYLSKDSTQDTLSLELELENELESILHIPIDVRIINYAPLSFQYNVIKTGILIVDNDTDFRVDFEGLTLKKYFDFVHLRNEYLREIVNAKF